ncbi:hypothetical protein EMCRGX_G004397 [Ephydatia muelleri]|eukprot:Em0007g406a
MSATDGHDISDIHTSTTVGESLSDPGAHGIDGSEAGHSVGVEHHPNIPVVGASVSISDPSAAVSINERSSTALLNLASSCSLTEILNVQQQALEQFQCQLQLAQQNEAINQRLDAIERTLNNLIHQKAQEEAVRSVGGQSVTPIRPSQQLDASISGSSNESKKKKLPRELCAKVRSTYNALNLEFKIDERFLSPNNQRATDALIDQVYSDAGGLYTIKDIKRAVHRYYESRRRLGIEELPDRQEKAAEQRKKRKYRARQQRSYDRRRKFVREAEMRYWEHISPACMTEESDSEQGERIVTHQLMWRSEFLNQFLMKLDARYERSKKPGTNSTIKRERIIGMHSTSRPPPALPSWMVNPDFKLPPSSVCLDPSEGDDAASMSGDVSYSSLIGEVQEVRDDSSDFELPETVVA